MRGSDGNYYHADPKGNATCKHNTTQNIFMEGRNNQSQLVSQNENYDRASDLFDRNHAVMTHNTHSHLPVDQSLRKSTATRVTQPKFWPSSAQQKTTLKLPSDNKQSQDLPKADIKSVRPTSGIKLQK